VDEKTTESSRQLRFLVVDDTDDIREVMARMVERQGHSADQAIDGVEAVEALQRTYTYYDPIHTLPQAGRDWWEQHGRLDESALKAAEVAEASRRTAALQAW
jgi:CheY-like chemotaxis protein